MIDPAHHKARVHGMIDALVSGAAVDEVYHPDALWFGAHPFNERTGHAAIAEVWSQIRTAFPKLERRTHLLAAGISKPDARTSPGSEGQALVASMGVYQGRFDAPFCDIPATGGLVALRVCEVHMLQGDRIMRSWVLPDLLDLMRQAGVWPFAPSLGTEGAWQPPARGALEPSQINAALGDRNYQTVLDMHGALLSFDGRSLDSMDHGRYWSEDFLWYGPAGIGTTIGMGGFRTHHQIPFLIGFPDRTGTGHYIRIGDGPFVVTGGWPSVRGTHLGEWLGLPPTGRPIDMRVMDFYRLSDGVIEENWVPIDVIHMALQMGFDVFARMRHLTGHPQTDLPTDYGARYGKTKAWD
ncbi:ester cyclase [Oceanomicrobium pacificus]|uniref:SnoaL-like domain-containing protein n=1 Tax=Oceanomicrobium pacificus TaxID=2692916 RepID=A0A6B0TSZ0_9RHOB|nr:ester cyclase [Oceanomicrobium pacificus]MXU64788.1 hypothetical protein [Oceanomicrobium pacificus]